jgi:hypothetical protein
MFWSDIFGTVFDFISGDEDLWKIFFCDFDISIAV